MTATVFNSVLGYVGRRGTTALAISILIGVALPSLSSYLRPYLHTCGLTLAHAGIFEGRPCRHQSPIRATGFFAWGFGMDDDRIAIFLVCHF